jgi:hypothetical protein
MVLFINYKTNVVDDGKKKKAVGGKRMIYTTHHACWDAKNRVGLPEEIEFVKDPNEGDNLVFNQYFKAHIPVFDRSIKEVEVKDIPKQEFKQPKEEPKEEVKKEIPEDEERAAMQAEGVNNKNLGDLMVEHDITEDQIRKVVAGFGIYPLETPINNYDEKFINGGLVADWDNVMKEMKSKGII